MDTTFVGTLRFNPTTNNFPPPHILVKQIQNRRWKIVWPTVAPTTKLQAPPAGVTE